MRFAFIEEQLKESLRKYPVQMMCNMLKVSRSGYYAWRDRTRRRRISVRAARRAQLIDRIKVVHQQSRRSYGSPRVHVELKQAGVSVCENTVAKYMKEAKISVQPRRRFIPRTTDSAHAHPIAPNVLQRNFTATAPDRKWACDLTYIFTEEGWLYLSVVIDLFSRRVIGWSMSDDLKAHGVAQALSMALQSRRPKGDLLHHSDRGVQYACELYRSVLQRQGITASMSRPGNCYDNAVPESFFGTLKTELVQRVRYKTREEARSSVFEWIECWYNRKRRHSSLGYLSPESFEAKAN